MFGDVNICSVLFVVIWLGLRRFSWGRIVSFGNVFLGVKYSNNCCYLLFILRVKYRVEELYYCIVFFGFDRMF